MRCSHYALALLLALGASLPVVAAQSSGGALSRTAAGTPDLSGFWQVSNSAAWDIQDHRAQKAMPAGQGVVEGNEIPYQAWAIAKKKENFENRATADPETKCYLPGVPRLTYMPFPLQIVQTPRDILVLHEYVHAVRTLHVDGSPHPPIRSTRGWATPAATGKATRSSSTRSISTTARGSIVRATSTATPCTSWSV